MVNDFYIRLENEEDYKTVENIVREAFWNVYKPGCAEHFVLHTYRQSRSFVRELDFVMEKDSEIIGQIMFVHAKIESDCGKVLPVMTFGPISILPKYQGRGFGKALLDFALGKATELGVGAVFMEGNIDFYGKCGFVTASTLGVHYYAEPREAFVPYFLGKELKKGFLNGFPGFTILRKAILSTIKT